MATSSERMAAGVGLGAFAKAEELKKRIWFTLGALIIYRLGTYLPLPGIDPGALSDIFLAAILRHSGHVRHVLRRRARADDDLRAQHHALHHRLDHHAADDGHRADPRAAEEGRRGGPQADQPVYPLSDGASGDRSGLRHRRRARIRLRGGVRSGAVLPHHDGDDACRRHAVPDVAWRADHQPRRRQRNLADHFRRHYRRGAFGSGRVRWSSAARARCRRS